MFVHFYAAVCRRTFRQSYGGLLSFIKQHISIQDEAKHVQGRIDGFDKRSVRRLYNKYLKTVRWRYFTILQLIMLKSHLYFIRQAMLSGLVKTCKQLRLILYSRRQRLWPLRHKSLVMLCSFTWSVRSGRAETKLTLYVMKIVSWINLLYEKIYFILWITRNKSVNSCSYHSYN